MEAAVGEGDWHLFPREDEFIADCEALARAALRPVAAAAELAVYLAVFEHQAPYVGPVELHPANEDAAPFARLREVLRVNDARGRDLGPVSAFDSGAFDTGGYSAVLSPTAPEEAARLFGGAGWVSAAASVDFVRYTFPEGDAEAAPDECWFAGALVARVRLPPEPVPPEQVDYHAVDRARLVRHVCEAALGRAASVLQRYVATDQPGGLPTPGEVLREGGRRLMEGVVPRGAALSGGALLDACTLISSLPYEKREAAGCMVMPLAADPGRTVALAFEAPIHLHQARAVRKKLEMCRRGLHLACDGARVLGLARDADLAPDDALTFRFARHHWWELRQGRTLLMGVRYGEPVLPQPQVDRERFRATFAERFPGAPASGAERLWEGVEAAMRQANGALLVISPEAEREARRLEASSTRVRPVPLDDELMLAATAIDGAVLLSPDGECHAIGVILDGRAAPDVGSGQRGARYNGTLRYLNTAPGTMAVVVSEDGDVELLF